MTPARAYEIASQWGSYVRSGDPGACFYGFHFNDGRPEHERHRALCQGYTRDLISHLSYRLEHERPALARQRLTAQTRRDLKDLKALQTWFNTCEVAA